MPEEEQLDSEEPKYQVRLTDEERRDLEFEELMAQIEVKE